MNLRSPALVLILSVACAFTGVGLWILAHRAAVGGLIPGYPALQHALLLSLGFILPAALTAPGLEVGRRSRFYPALPVAVAVVLVVSWLSFRMPVGAAGFVLSGIGLSVLWIRGETQVPARLGTMALALAMAGSTLLLVLELVDFAAPYQLGSSLIFRGALPLIGLALLAGRLGLEAGNGPLLRMNVALSGFAAGFALEFVSSVFLRMPASPRLASVAQGISGLWLLFELALLRLGKTAPRAVAPPEMPPAIETVFWLSPGLSLAAGLFWPEEAAHTVHFGFVGSASLLVVLPARPGSSSLVRRLAWAAVVLCFAAAATRATAHFWPHIYRSHILYASSMFLPPFLFLATLRIRELHRSGAAA